jgi:hypothetical protein
VICAKFAPDGAAELYYAGTKVFETTAAGISITDGTATAATIGFSSDDLIIKNNDAGGHIFLQNSDGDNLAKFNSDSDCQLYHNNAVSIKTHSNGTYIADAGTDFILITGSTGPDFLSLTHGGDFQFRAEDDGGTARTCMLLEPSLNGTSSGIFGINMPDAAVQNWDVAPASDLTGSGDTFTDTVDQNTVGVGGVLRMENAGGDGNWDDGDKDAATTAGYLAIALQSGTGTKVLMSRGYIRNDAWSWTPGEQLFLGDSGAITDSTGVAAFTSGDIIQVIGYAHTATVVYFNPSPTYDEVA